MTETQTLFPAPQTVRLTTERLTLRPLALTDGAALHPHFSDPETMRYWSDIPSDGMAETGRRLALRLERDHSTTLDMAIDLNGSLIGSVSLFKYKDGVMELGYFLGRPHWGQGLASEACRAMLNFGFETWHLHRVEAFLHPKNKASARLLKRLRFQREGLLRQNFLRAGDYEDTLIMGLLRPEWRG